MVNCWLFFKIIALFFFLQNNFTVHGSTESECVSACVWKRALYLACKSQQSMSVAYRDLTAACGARQRLLPTSIPSFPFQQTRPEPSAISRETCCFGEFEVSLQILSPIQNEWTPRMTGFCCRTTCRQSMAKTKMSCPHKSVSPTQV